MVLRVHEWKRRRLGPRAITPLLWQDSRIRTGGHAGPERWRAPPDVTCEDGAPIICEKPIFAKAVSGERGLWKRSFEDPQAAIRAGWRTASCRSRTNFATAPTAVPMKAMPSATLNNTSGAVGTGKLSPAGQYSGLMGWSPTTYQTLDKRRPCYAMPIRDGRMSPFRASGPVSREYSGTV
jgi:hypothetical protein